MAVIKEQTKALTSDDIKLKLLEYYRKKGFYCCTEFCMMDVFAFRHFPGDPAKHPVGLEIEIKTSKADLRADIKKHKHNRYGYFSGLNGIDDIHNFLANKFYYAVPGFLVENAIQQCKELNNKYGVIEIPLKSDPIVRKRALKFDFKLNMQQVWHYFAGRCSNEILMLRNKIKSRM